MEKPNTRFASQLKDEEEETQPSLKKVNSRRRYKGRKIA